MGTLSLKNLQAKPVRTACLMVVVAILAFTIFGGSVITMNLSQGLDTIQKRFGADLMVVPEGSSERAETLLLRGGINYFYFDPEITEKILHIDGVIQASPQLYLASLANTACCDEEVQLIAYDPASDFVVQPWTSEKYSESVTDGQVVVGNNVSIRRNGKILLLGHEYPVAAQLSSSASGFDTSIFMTMNTMKLVISRAQAAGINFLPDNYTDGLISAVLVKTEPQTSSSLIAHNIREQNENAEVIISQGVFSRISSALSGFVMYIQFFSIALWALAVVVLAAVYSGSIHERKKEFALLRIIGATRKRLVGIVLCESSLVGIAGGALGIALACMFIFPFADLISIKLDLPYLDPSIIGIITLVTVSLLISAAVGPLASLYSAYKISKAETYFTMREGE